MRNVPMASNFLVPNGTFFVELIAFAIMFCILAQVRHPADQQGDDGAPGRDPQGVRGARRGQAGRAARPRQEFKAQIADARHEAARIREEAREQGAADHRRDARAGPGRGGADRRARARPDRRRAAAGGHVAARRGRHAGHRARRPDRRREPRGRRAQQPRGRPLPGRPRDARDRQGRRGEPTDVARCLGRGAGRPERAARSTRTLRRRRDPRRGAVRGGRRAARRARAAPGAHRRAVEGEAKAGLAPNVFGSARRRPTRSAVVDATPSSGAGRSRATWPTCSSTSASSRSSGRPGQDASRVSDELFAVAPAGRRQPRPARRAVRPGPRRRPTGGLLRACSAARRCRRPRAGQQAVSGSRPHRRHARSTSYQDIAAGAQGETVATVHTARALADADRDRLADALGKQYDTTVHLHVVVDPTSSAGRAWRSVTTSSTARSSSRLDDARRSSPADAGRPPRHLDQTREPGKRQGT